MPEAHERRDYCCPAKRDQHASSDGIEEILCGRCEPAVIAHWLNSQRTAALIHLHLLDASVVALRARTIDASSRFSISHGRAWSKTLKRDSPASARHTQSSQLHHRDASFARLLPASAPLHALHDTSSSAPTAAPPSPLCTTLLLLLLRSANDTRTGARTASGHCRQHLTASPHTHAFRCACAIPTRHLHHHSIPSAHLPLEHHGRCFCTASSGLLPRLVSAIASTRGLRVPS